MAILLLSKRKYFPQLFPTDSPRDCRIYRYIAKIKKLINPQVTFLSHFLQHLSR